MFLYHIHKNHRHIKHIKGVYFCWGSKRRGGGDGSLVGGPVFLCSGCTKHLSAWIYHPKGLLAVTAYNMHMLTAQTGKFEDDAASALYVCVSG